MSDRLSYTLKEAAAVTGISVDVLTAAIHSDKHTLRARALSISPTTGRASKYVILRGDLEDWLQGLAAS